MKAYELIKINRKARNVTPLESAHLDLSNLRVNNMPSSETNQLVTFSLILSDFYQYLELGGRKGRIQSVTPTVDGFLDVISKFTELVGFPSECRNEFETAMGLEDDGIKDGDLATATAKASLRIQEIVYGSN